MKAGWQSVPLGEAVRLNYGKAIPKEVRGPVGPVPVYGANGIMDFCETPLAEGPSLIIGRKGSAGAINLASDAFWASDVTYFTDHNASRIDFSFLHYLLRQIDLPSLAKGIKPGINREEVYALPIPLPPLDEQKRIVATLDEAFEGLSRARANTESNLADARELFDNSLRAEFSKSSMTAPAMTLAEAALTFGRGKSRHRPRNDPKLYGGDYPFVQTGEIRNSDGVVTTYSQTYNELGLAQSKLWPEGTLCITIAANIAETAILGFSACFPDSIIGMICDPEKAIPEYVELMLRYFAADLKSKGKGSAQDNINLATFEQSKFPVPEIAEQERVVALLSEIAQERRNLEAHFLMELSDLDTLRQSLLQKAFSGELTG